MEEYKIKFINNVLDFNIENAEKYSQYGYNESIEFSVGDRRFKMIKELINQKVYYTLKEGRIKLYKNYTKNQMLRVLERLVK